MSKHTPGPWYVGNEDRHDQPQVLTLPGELIAVITHECVKQPPELQANAALIAAAPDLYKALKECADALHDIATGKGGWAWEEVLDTARAALTKATNEQTES